MSLFRRRTAGSASLPIEGHLPGFEGATSWLNARPLGEADLRGKADWDTLESPETYLGYEQARNFASAADAALDRRRTYVAPASLTHNEWALRGDWTIARGASILDCADGRIVFRIHARRQSRHGAARERGASVPFRVLVDGEAPSDAHGVDVDDAGRGTVTQQRLYQLIRQRGPFADRTFEITFLAAGVEAYVFTFG
jgi:hypothetical protein